jgi:hypothetical protein
MHSNSRVLRTHATYGSGGPPGFRQPTRTVKSTQHIDTMAHTAQIDADPGGPGHKQRSNDVRAVRSGDDQPGREADNKNPRTYQPHCVRQRLGPLLHKLRGRRFGHGQLSADSRAVRRQAISLDQPHVAPHGRRPIPRLHPAHPVKTSCRPHVPLQVAHLKLQPSRELLAAVDAGSVDFGAACRVLSDHHEGTLLDGPKFNPARQRSEPVDRRRRPAGSGVALVELPDPAGGRGRLRRR